MRGSLRWWRQSRANVRSCGDRTGPPADPRGGDGVACQAAKSRRDPLEWVGAGGYALSARYQILPPPHRSPLLGTCSSRWSGREHKRCFKRPGKLRSTSCSVGPGTLAATSSAGIATAICPSAPSGWAWERWQSGFPESGAFPRRLPRGGSLSRWTRPLGPVRVQRLFFFEVAPFPAVFGCDVDYVVSILSHLPSPPFCPAGLDYREDFFNRLDRGNDQPLPFY